MHERPYPYKFPSLQLSNSPQQHDPDSPDIVVFGHEHRTVVEDKGSTLFINPGSPTFLNYRRGLGTAGILTIDSSRPQVHILQL